MHSLSLELSRLIEGTNFNWYISDDPGFTKYTLNHSEYGRIGIFSEEDYRIVITAHFNDFERDATLTLPMIKENIEELQSSLSKLSNELNGTSAKLNVVNELIFHERMSEKKFSIKQMISSFFGKSKIDLLSEKKNQILDDYSSTKNNITEQKERLNRLKEDETHFTEHNGRLKNIHQDLNILENRVANTHFSFHRKMSMYSHEARTKMVNI